MLKRWLLPLVLLQLYLAISLLLYFQGPWPWPTINSNRLILFLVLSQIFIAAGYLSGFYHLKGLNRFSYDSGRLVHKLFKSYKFSMVITALFIIPTSLSRSGLVIPDLITGIFSTGKSYNDFQAISGSMPIVEYGRILFSPVLVAFFPMTIFLWNYMARSRKLMAALLIFYWISIYVSSGVNKGLADFIITLPVFLVAHIFWSKSRFISIKKILISCLVLLILFLSFFGEGQKHREGGVGAEGVFNIGSSIIYSDRDSNLTKNLPESVLIIYESLSRYINQGYYALDKSFDIENSHTAFLGHSMFLSRQANRIIDTTYFTDNSLPGVLEKNEGYGMYSLWHSIYVWLMSDFGYLGTLLCMAVFGYLLSVFWSETIIRPSVLSLSGLYLMSILFAYVPGNNQIFQSGETTVAFIFTCLWLFLIKIQRSCRGVIK